MAHEGGKMKMRAVEFIALPAARRSIWERAATT